MPVRAVTFDFHNTLAACDAWFEIEIRTLVVRVLQCRAARRGREVDQQLAETAIASYRRLRTEIIQHGDELDALACTLHVLAEIGIDAGRDELERDIEGIMRSTLDESTPVGGAVEAVRELAREGIALGVVSSAVYHPFLVWSLDKFGILDAFTIVVTSASAGYYKTRPEIYLHTLETLGAIPGESVHVGDSYLYDVLGAQRAGMKTVWYSQGRPHPEPNDANLTVESLDSLATRVLRHFNGTP
jgi:FMN phosphatase YigB (HAD superfamily)